MANDNKKYIPAIRFPEFQNDGEWKRCKLSDVAVRKGKKNTKGIELPVYTNSATSGVISQEDYFDREIVTKENLVNYGIIEPNDFVYNPRVSVTAPVGPISRNKLSRGIMSPLYLIFGFNGGDINFFEHYFKGNSWHNYLRAKANYGARFDRINIGTKEFMDMPIPYPSLAEQKKVVDCLSSLDKYIDAAKRKLDLLKEHKRGLMQKLFPAKGKTLPELRFPEFQNDGEWVEVPFGSIINVNSGKDYKHLDVGNIPVYGTGGYMLSVNDRLSDIDAVGIGRKGTIDKPQYLKAPFWTVDTLFFLTSSKNYDIRYLYYLCQTIPWKTYGEQTGVPSLSKNSIDKLDVVITTNLVEQQKIAQSLLHLDNAMDAIEKKIHLLETHKYGLMQNLFPNLNNY
ncbi:MAG: restriction endonuclease subunit S [Paludibacteraceae bacterium]|nr:restriction endonuclease subunit S [Paludibacteraceae bacterium]